MGNMKEDRQKVDRLLEFIKAVTEEICKMDISRNEAVLKFNIALIQKFYEEGIEDGKEIERQKRTFNWDKTRKLLK